MRNFLYNQAVNSPYLEHSHIKYCDSTYFIFEEVK
jgi:hypothetical protein